MPRPRHEHSVSLFPFLAVLVCAMGALILLLLVTTRQIRETQQEERARVLAESAAPDSETSRKADEAAAADKAARRQRLQTLNAQLADAEAHVALLRDETSFLRDQVADARRAIRERQTQLAALPSEDTSETATDAKRLAALRTKIGDGQAEAEKQTAALRAAEAELADKLALLTEAERKVDELSRATVDARSAVLLLRRDVADAEADATPAVAGATLIEFTNTTGTAHTPIVIDVRDGAFELLPSGIQITMNDLRGTPLQDNPLLAGILTAHRVRTGDSLVAPEPYVLLLVRPSGAVPFYAAQKLLTETGLPFGYELLEEDRLIAAGSADAGERGAIRDAVLQSLARRDALVAGADDRRSALDDETTERTRGFVFRPDGRIVRSDNSPRRGLPARAYAGGIAPPTGRLRPPPQDEARGRPRTLDLPESRSTRSTAPEIRSRPGRPPIADLTSPNTRSTRSAARTADTPDRADQEGSWSATDTEQRSDGDASEVAAAESFESLLEGQVRHPSIAGGPAARGAAPSAEREFRRNPNIANLPELPESLRGTEPVDDVPRSGMPEAPQRPGRQSDFRPQSVLPPGVDPPGPVRIDPDLLRQLAEQNREAASPGLSTPVGITVFVDEYHVTVGQRPAVFVTEVGMEKAVAELMRGVSDEVADVRQDLQEPLLPIVRFIVSPGGQRLKRRLELALRASGIPAATVLAMEPYIVPSSGLATFSSDQPGGGEESAADDVPAPRDVSSRPPTATGADRGSVGERGRR